MTRTACLIICVSNNAKHAKELTLSLFIVRAREGGPLAVTSSLPVVLWCFLVFLETKPRPVWVRRTRRVGLSGSHSAGLAQQVQKVALLAEAPIRSIGLN